MKGLSCQRLMFVSCHPSNHWLQNTVLTNGGQCSVRSDPMETMQELLLLASVDVEKQTIMHSFD